MNSLLLQQPHRSEVSMACLSLLALAPVLSAADSIERAAGLGAAVIAVLAVLRAADRLLGARLTDAARHVALAVLAGATVALLGLVAAAFVPGGFTAMKSQLPLVAASSLLLSGALALLGERAGPRRYRAELATACTAALALVATGTLRQGLAHVALLASHPAGALLIVALILAGTNHWRSRRRADSHHAGAPTTGSAP